jgi:hypothetical protein
MHQAAIRKLFVSDSKDDDPLVVSHKHIVHCIDISEFQIVLVRSSVETDRVLTVRQTIMCLGEQISLLVSDMLQLTFRQGDTTLERGEEELNEATGQLVWRYHGVGAVHQCRDWRAVTDFLVENRAYNYNRSILHT